MDEKCSEDEEWTTTEDEEWATAEESMIVHPRSSLEASSQPLTQPRSSPLYKRPRPSPPASPDLPSQPRSSPLYKRPKPSPPESPSPSRENFMDSVPVILDELEHEEEVVIVEEVVYESSPEIVYERLKRKKKTRALVDRSRFDNVRRRLF